ncbi:MAG: hypothetical protein ABSG08_21830 [Terriglobales bacterium]|jgi:hypothetical protein
MTRLEERIAELVQRKGKTEHLLPTIEAAGYDMREVLAFKNPDDVFNLYSAIRADLKFKEAVERRRPKYENELDKPFDFGLLQVLDSWSDIDKASLRARVAFIPCTGQGDYLI